MNRPTTVRWATRPLLTALVCVLLAMPAGVISAERAEQALVPKFWGVQEGQTLRGTVTIQALVEGADVVQVDFVLSAPRSATHSEGEPPYTFLGDVGEEPIGWDTTEFPDGEYTLVATATDVTGRTGSATVRFRVANSPT